MLVVRLVVDTDRPHGDRDIPCTAPTPTTTPGGTPTGLVLVDVITVTTVAVLVIASGIVHCLAIIAVGVALTGAWSLVRPTRRFVRPPGSVIASRSPIRPLRSAIRPARSLVHPRVRRACARACSE
ncbi:hypothetical protein AB0I98_37430 [Streptomyces sp. NPDC050211]|uniref:hypothetical protein n=1 Tax=Streptomyces sp. NPDC050211 TaxID=3154932 RepID=UPI0034247C69